MLLQNKNAVIYGAGGSLGGAVARALAKAGANVFLTGHHAEPVKKVAEDILSAGGTAVVAEVDAMDAEAINNHLQAVVQEAGSIDISFNAIGWKDRQDIPLIDMLLEDFLRPVQISMQTEFLTMTAAGRIMKQQGSGVILSLTATPGGIGYPQTGGFGVACCAVESLSRNLAAELGRFGVRVVNIRSGGSPDSKPFAEARKAFPEEMEGVMKKLKDDTMLKQLPMMEDIANVAVFLSSGMSAKITGVTIDVTCGTTSALNYKFNAEQFIPLFDQQPAS